MPACMQTSVHFLKHESFQSDQILLQVRISEYLVAGIPMCTLVVFCRIARQVVTTVQVQAAMRLVE